MPYFRTWRSQQSVVQESCIGDLRVECPRLYFRASSAADELIIQHLGASVLLCWHELPLTVQGQILAQSNDVVGVAPISGIRDRIVRLVLRRAPRW
jgi:hypothetical protein